MNERMATTSIKEYTKQFSRMILAARTMRKIKRDNLIDKQFIERIMLAVTQVNGCSICSYEHTKIAFKSGISQLEIDEILSGDFENIPDDQKMAVIFAQHYAYTRGNPDGNALFKLRAYYGREKAEAIRKVIDIIMFGNAYGIAWLNFKDRLKNKPVKKSRLSRELVIIAAPFLLIVLPLLIIVITVKTIRK
ncbi:MAG: carboxymuconolactone decarboxylase family protein [Erysipelotrichaceae bacterium]|nr:carboxymuconolactone decarboxylase family protein [Erysipelotrichaceae bacterium]